MDHDVAVAGEVGTGGVGGDVEVSVAGWFIRICRLVDWVDIDA
jgi:hypothetical protein